MRTLPKKSVAAGTGLLLGLTAMGAAPASAHEGWDDDQHGRGDWHSEPVAQGLNSPLLGLAVDRRGNAYVSTSKVSDPAIPPAGVITKISRRGVTEDVVVTAPGASVSGVAVGLHGQLAWLELSESTDQPPVPVGSLKVRAEDGTVTTVTDQLAQHELVGNPDADVEYGFTDLSDECKTDFPDPLPPDHPAPDPEPGDVNPNPYKLAFGRHGSFFVADAGGNTILRVSESGEVSTVAVLPPVPTTVTAELQQAVGLPECTIGHDYLWHPVPTDVEVGDDGMLYVSSLPGGPEDATLGRRGGVFRVNPWTGRVRAVATGFLGAVDLALDDDGGIYVAELFGGAISKVTWRGEARKVLDIASPGAIEYFRGQFYVTSGNGFEDFGQPNGSVVRIRL